MYQKGGIKIKFESLKFYFGEVQLQEEDERNK